jgi:two-component system sensor histidine kinase/response regulator
MPPIYDHAESLRRMGNDGNLFLEMVGLLRTDAPLWLQALHSAQHRGDAQRTQRAAHTLKGLAANFGAERAVAAAAAVERLAKAHSSDGLTGAVAELDESLNELLTALTPTCETSR